MITGHSLTVKCDDWRWQTDIYWLWSVMTGGDMDVYWLWNVMIGDDRWTFTDCEVWWLEVTWMSTDCEMWWLEMTDGCLLTVKCDDWRWHGHLLTVKCDDWRWQMDIYWLWSVMTGGMTVVAMGTLEFYSNASASVCCQVLERETKCFSVRSTAAQGTMNFIQSDANCFSVTPRVSACETKSFSLKPTASEWDQEFQSVINCFID